MKTTDDVRVPLQAQKTVDRATFDFSFLDKAICSLGPLALRFECLLRFSISTIPAWNSRTVDLTNQLGVSQATTDKALTSYELRIFAKNSTGWIVEWPGVLDG